MSDNAEETQCTLAEVAVLAAAAAAPGKETPASSSTFRSIGKCLVLMGGELVAAAAAPVRETSTSSSTSR